MMSTIRGLLQFGPRPLHFSFSPHVTAITTRAKSRLKVLQALAGSSWGHQKETMLNTYKSLIRPITTYAAPVWFPNTSPSNVQKIQRVQNSALRICLGAHNKASSSHLHSESKILPVDDHLQLLCAQHLASARPLGPRPKKCTLQSRFLEPVSPFLTEGILPLTSYKLTIANLHTQYVQNAISNLDPNPVLNTPAPPIHPSETQLPRPYRSILTQLRSSYCSRLQSFQFGIDKSPSPICPHCRQDEQTTNHLFSCPSFPTTLSPIDLWESPVDVAHLLQSHPDFSQLPDLPRPPPEPPPPPAI